MSFIKILCLFFAVTICTVVSAQDHSIDNLPTDKAKLDTLARHTRRLMMRMDFPKAIQTAKQGIALAERVSADSAVSIFYTLLSRSYYGRQEGDSLLNYARKGEYYAIKSKKPFLQVAALSNMQNFFMMSGKLDSAYYVLKRMDSLAQRLNMAKVSISVAMNLSRYYGLKGDYARSLGFDFKALEYSTKAKDSAQMSVMLYSIGENYYSLKDYARSLDYYKQSGAMMHKGHASFTYYGLAGSYANLGKPDSAIYYYNKTIEMSVANNDNQLEITALQGLSAAYQKEKKFAEAEKALVKAEQIGKNKSLTLRLAGAQDDLAKLYVTEQQYPKAGRVLSELLPMAKKLGDKLVMADAYTLQAKIDSTTRDFNKATADRNAQELYHDSVVNVTSVKSIAEMETKYQTAKKQEQINLLAQKEKTQAIELSAQRRTKYFLIACLVFVLAIVGLTIRSYRLKQKANEIALEKNTELEIKNQQLKTLNEALNEANSSKTKLFGILSHDLRAPVGSLFQFLSLQKNHANKLNEAQKLKHNERIITSAENLMESMEDLLIWSKSQMDSFSLQLSPVNACELVSSTFDLHRDFAEAKQITLEQDCPQEVIVDTDANFMKIVLRNIVSNGIKFTPAGGTIRIAVEKDETSVLFKVFDNGVGMNKEQIDNLFEWGSIRSDTSGLGLKLAREFTSRLGGTLQVNSTPGKGTTFTVALPVTKMAESSLS